MKKFISILFVALLALSLAACGAANGGDNGTDQPGNEAASVNSALELLTTVWGNYAEEEKFPVFGGDTSDENLTMDAPGKYALDDAAVLDNTLGFPAASVSKIDDAASLVHMMNANTFTCGAFHVANAADVDAVAAELKDNIMNRQWICGFPEKLVIVNVDGYLVSFYGTTDLVDAFKTALTTTYASAQTICDEPIAL